MAKTVPSTSALLFAARPALLRRSALAVDLSTSRCVRCAAGDDVRLARVGGALPLPLAVALALAVPLVLAVVVRAAFGAGDLYDAMATGGGGAALWAVAPVWAPTLVIPFAMVATALAPRPRLSFCGRCRRRNRLLGMVAWVGLTVGIATLAAALHYFGRSLLTSEWTWGTLFIPWAFVASWLVGRSSRMGVRARPLTRQALAITDAPLLDELLGEAHPAALIDGTPSRISPPLAALALWLVPLIVVVALQSMPEVRLGDGLCGYGTYPLGFRMGDARVTACTAPDGARHGRFVGEAGSWNTSSNIAVEGTFFRGAAEGAFVFRDRCGVVRATGLVADGHPDVLKGWRFFDATGAPRSVDDARAAAQEILAVGADCP